RGVLVVATDNRLRTLAVGSELEARVLAEVRDDLVEGLLGELNDRMGRVPLPRPGYGRLNPDGSPLALHSRETDAGTKDAMESHSSSTGSSPPRLWRAS